MGEMKGREIPLGANWEGLSLLPEGALILVSQMRRGSKVGKERQRVGMSKGSQIYLDDSKSAMKNMS